LVQILKVLINLQNCVVLTLYINTNQQGMKIHTCQFKHIKSTKDMMQVF